MAPLRLADAGDEREARFVVDDVAGPQPRSGFSLATGAASTVR